MPSARARRRCWIHRLRRAHAATRPRRSTRCSTARRRRSRRAHSRRASWRSAPRAARAKVVRLRARVAAAVGLAAAASLAIWLTQRPAARQTLRPAAVAQLGEYQTPTDALLSALDLDADDTMPELGCDDPEVDCDDSDPAQQHPKAGARAARQESYA